MIRTLLIAITVFALMSTVVAYAATSGTTEDQIVNSPTDELVTIGWNLAGHGQVDGVTVTWTPYAAAVYTIEATVGNNASSITTPLTDTSERTDIVPIARAGAEAINSVNVAILEN